MLLTLYQKTVFREPRRFSPHIPGSKETSSSINITVYYQVLLRTKLSTFLQKFVLQKLQSLQNPCLLLMVNEFIISVR